MKEPKETTKVLSETRKPTCHLKWENGVLCQMWEIEQRFGIYLDERFQYDFYRKNEEWMDVPGLEK